MRPFACVAAWAALLFSVTGAHTLKVVPAPLAERPQAKRVFVGTAPPRGVARRAPGGVVRALAIRVDFPPPRPEDGCAISGNGSFDLSGEDVPDRYPGAPPHNKRYFEGVMEALRRYLLVQSYGAFQLEYRVVPDGMNDAYRMPRRTAYYSYYRNPNDLAEREDRLALLAADALRLADADTSVTMAEFDVYVVFHAGGDWQHDYKGDSPCDPLTAYIPSLARFLGEPVAVDGGTHSVDDVIVMPEAVNQDLDPSKEIECLHSELAHEFGHWLGLLDLYDYHYFSNVVGYWSLMDNGDGMALQDQHGRILRGVLPPSLCAFSKALLGWVVPQELVEEGEYEVHATTLAPSSYLARVSDTEYFLIEQRQTDTDGDPTVYLKVSHGVVLGPTTATGDITTSEYDAGLPGSGLLIWHVDRSRGLWDVGLPNWVEYDAQADTLVRLRGVALEEADGVENIGLWYFENPAHPSRPVDPRGTEGDPFRAGHNDRFGDHTRPASRDNRGRLTHLEISGISGAAPTMRFSFRRTWSQPGWPVAVTSAPLSPPVVVSTRGGPAVLTCGRGVVWAVWGPGAARPLWDSRQPLVHPVALFPVPDERGHLVAVAGQGGRLALLPLEGPGAGTPLAGWPVSPLPGPLTIPALADLDGDGLVEVVCGGGDTRVTVLREDGRVVPGWPVEVGEGVTAPAVADVDGDGLGEVVVGGRGVWVVRLDGHPLDGWPALEGEPQRFLDPLAADLEGDGVVDIVVASERKAWVLDPRGRVRGGWPVEAHRQVENLALMDVEGDGSLDVVAIDSGGVVWAWTPRGDPVADCAGWGRGAKASPFLLGVDAEGDGWCEFMGLREGLDLWAPTGRSLQGWPLSVDGVTGATLADLDGDGDLEAVATDSAGVVRAWDLPIRQAPRWALPRGNPAMTGWAGRGTVATGPLVKVEDFYVWPSPVRGGRGAVSFRARPGAHVFVSILDPTGRRVDSWGGEASGLRQDWRWTRTLPMGVYLCRLEVHDRGDEAVFLHKFAVGGGGQ